MTTNRSMWEAGHEALGIVPLSALPDGQIPAVAPSQKTKGQPPLKLISISWEATAMQPHLFETSAMLSLQSGDTPDDPLSHSPMCTPYQQPGQLPHGSSEVLRNLGRGFQNRAHEAWNALVHGFRYQNVTPPQRPPTANPGRRPGDWAVEVRNVAAQPCDPVTSKLWGTYKLVDTSPPSRHEVELLSGWLDGNGNGCATTADHPVTPPPPCLLGKIPCILGGFFREAYSYLISNLALEAHPSFSFEMNSEFT